MISNLHCPIQEANFNGNAWGNQGPRRITETLFKVYPHLREAKTWFVKYEKSGSSSRNCDCFAEGFRSLSSMSPLKVSITRLTSPLPFSRVVLPIQSCTLKSTISWWEEMIIFFTFLFHLIKTVHTWNHVRHLKSIKGCQQQRISYGKGLL